MQEIKHASRRATARYILITAKIALSVGLIYYAFSNIDLQEAWLQMRNISVLAVIATIAMLFLEIVVASVRLRQILAILGPRCRLIQALDVVFIGAFFSQTLISFVGGDAMRIWRIVRANVPVGLAAKGVVFDRVAGFAGLFVLVLLTLPYLLTLVRDHAMRVALVIALTVVLTGFIVFVMFKHLPAALRRLKLLQWLSELSAVAISMARNKQVFASLLGLSLTIQLLNVVILYVIAVGLAIQLSFWHCLLLVPPVLFLSMLPVSFAGWGVRESAMIVALGLVGVPAFQSVVLSVFFGLSVLAISLPGALLWFLHRGQAMPLTATADRRRQIDESRAPRG